MMPAYLQRLALGDDADERAIRRAYARELKQIDQEADPAAFQSLREAYEAALAWAQWQKDQQLASPHDQAFASDTDQADHVVHAAAADAIVAPEFASDAPAAAPDSAELAPHIAQADAAFAALLQGIDSDAPHTTIDIAFWQARLEHSLDQLVSIEARGVFEQHVAGLLVHGWRPGHEMLLIAAADRFNWKEDRHRLYSLGTAGAMLNQALEEHAMFSLQKEHARWQQSLLIARLRNLQPPSSGELIRHHTTLGWLQANYSNWLSIITNADAIPRWQQAYDDLPPWRRKLSPAGWGKPDAKPFELQGGFSWKWLWLLLIVGLIRMCASFSGDKPKPPPPPQQQQAAKPSMLSGDYLHQGDTHLQNKKYKEAINSYNQLIDLTPNNYMAWIGRGLAHLGLGEDLQAEKDFNQSAALDNDNHALHTARGKLAMYRKQPEDAITAYSKAIAMLPEGNVHLLSLRADAYDQLGDRQHALDDVNAMIKATSEMPSIIYTERLRLMMQLGRITDAEVGAVLTRFSTEGDVYRIIATLYRDHGLNQKARSVIERGIKALPADASLLLMRASLRTPDDLHGRRTDLSRASKLEPHAILPVQERVDLEIGAGNLPAAANIIAEAIKRWPEEKADRPMLIALRGVITARQGNSSAAEQDFSDALKVSSEPWQMNNVCWIMAVRNTALPTALFICNAALELKPDHRAALDSRGLVLLRMGRNQDALDSYEAALALTNGYANSLLGRGIARQRLGDRAGGEADIKAALKSEPALRQEYIGYGFKL